jgi:hypothetical protein
MATSSQPSTTPPFAAILQLLGAGDVAAAVACLAKLGVPDHLEDGPRSAEELAKEVGANPQALYRLMRATASIGVLAEGPDGKFSQTPLSGALRTNAKPSIRGFAIMNTATWWFQGWQRLDYSVRTGKTALDEVFGMPVFEYLAQNPSEAQIFNDGMTSLSAIDSPAVALSYSFEGINSLLDVGGGHGLLLATILGMYPRLKGILFDSPHVVAGAKEGPLKPYLDRSTFASGDMFASVPSGADAYIMKHIIHDWPDDKCIQLLKNCRRAVNVNGKLLVVDHVIPPGNDFHPGKFLDLAMLLFPGGKERTETEFRDLFAASGWRLNRVIPTPAVECIIEGVPA